jgi:hypothetical protein
MVDRKVAELVRIINRKRHWGVKITDWRLSERRTVVVAKFNPHYPVEILTVTLSAEVNRTYLEAPINVFLDEGRLLGLNIDYIGFGLNYRNLGSSPKDIAIPITAFLLGRYLKEIFPPPEPTKCLVINPDKACMVVRDPLLTVRAVVTRRDHKVVITYKPQMRGYINFAEIETDIHDAPQAIKALLAFSERGV